jgi:hypothetical protein
MAQTVDRPKQLVDRPKQLVTAWSTGISPVLLPTASGKGPKRQQPPGPLARATPSNTTI